MPGGNQHGEPKSHFWMQDSTTQKTPWTTRHLGLPLWPQLQGTRWARHDWSSLATVPSWWLTGCKGVCHHSPNSPVGAGKGKGIRCAQ